MNFLLETLPPILNFVGAIVVGFGLLISKKQAVKLGVSRYGGSDEENAKLPAVQDRIKQRNLTIVGLLILFVGLVLELASTYLS